MCCYIWRPRRTGGSPLPPIAPLPTSLPVTSGIMALGVRWTHYSPSLQAPCVFSHSPFLRRSTKWIYAGWSPYPSKGHTHLPRCHQERTTPHKNPRDSWRGTEETCTCTGKPCDRGKVIKPIYWAHSGICRYGIYCRVLRSATRISEEPEFAHRTAWPWQSYQPWVAQGVSSGRAGGLEGRDDINILFWHKK